MAFGTYLLSVPGIKFGGVLPNCISYADATLLPNQAFFPNVASHNTFSVGVRGFFYGSQSSGERFENTVGSFYVSLCVMSFCWHDRKLNAGCIAKVHKFVGILLFICLHGDRSAKHCPPY